MGENRTNEEIGRQLFISPCTVHTHRNNIRDKLDLHDARGLLLFALDHKEELQKIRILPLSTKEPPWLGKTPRPVSPGLAIHLGQSFPHDGYLWIYPNLSSVRRRMFRGTANRVGAGLESDQDLSESRRCCSS